ncbi:hypothetical protein Q8A73_004133 [Channa argus]|nr:hypothetical protein Q8A73_004133 [Channa argus]
MKSSNKTPAPLGDNRLGCQRSPSPINQSHNLPLTEQIRFSPSGGPKLPDSAQSAGRVADWPVGRPTCRLLALEISVPWMRVHTFATEFRFALDKRGRKRGKKIFVPKRRKMNRGIWRHKSVSDRLKGWNCERTDTLLSGGTGGNGERRIKRQRFSRPGNAAGFSPFSQTPNTPRCSLLWPPSVAKQRGGCLSGEVILPTPATAGRSREEEARGAHMRPEEQLGSSYSDACGLDASLRGRGGRAKRPRSMIGEQQRCYSAIFNSTYPERGGKSAAVVVSRSITLHSYLAICIRAS